MFLIRASSFWIAPAAVHVYEAMRRVGELTATTDQTVKSSTHAAYSDAVGAFIRIAKAELLADQPY